VNAEIANGDDESKATACDIWRNLVRMGGTGHGVEINAVLDLIDTESGRAMHAAFGLMEALLRGAGDREGLVAALVCASPTEKGVQTFQAEEVWGRDFEALRGCAVCLSLIIEQAGPAEMEELAEPETVRALVQFLALEDEEMVLQVLGALDAVFVFARAAGEERWATVHQAWFEADGPETLLGLTQECDCPELANFQDRFCAMIESDDSE
jgi:hypothetical protein